MREQVCATVAKPARPRNRFVMATANRSQATFRRLMMGAAVVASTLLALPAQAQPARQPPPDEPAAAQPASKDPGFVEKARGMLDSLHRRGIYPEVDTIVSSSGLAFGGTYRTPALRGSGISAEAGLMWSVKNYREYTGRVGRLGGMRHTVGLDAAGTEVTSSTNVHSRKKTGSALYVEARHFNYRQVDYFGVDPVTEGPHADYALTGSTFDLVGQWQPRTHFGVSGRWGLLEITPAAGSNSSLPNVDEVYSATAAPGLIDRPRYVTAGVGAAWDSRDSSKVPTRGVFGSAVLWRFNARNNTARSFTRFTGDLRAFHPWSDDGRHVLAVSLMASADRTPGSQPVPFYLQGWLGGSHTLRSLSNYRLRGESLVAASLEHRWRVHRFIEVAPFFDIGAASSTERSLSDGPLYTAAGAGIRLRTDDRIWLRIDGAYGDNGGRLLFAWSPAF